MLPTIKVNQEVVEAAVNRFKFHHKHSEHGIGHWLRVMANGFAIAEKNENVDPSVVFWFALFHDSCRENEMDDPQHGERASDFLENFRDQIGLNDEQFDKLKEACATHSEPILHEDPTIAACHDADRLDLARVRIITNPEYLTLDESKDPVFLDACISNARQWTVDERFTKWLGVEHLFEVSAEINDFFSKHSR